ncbi:branched-chain amino acid transport system II carrier protein, partial [Staphylococcus pasteuri]|uniref:branched-chain amino acid transport system II carrier protein n=1 Tax=Staphylococcus pasteuri TaxID=45972 RepID=UPI001649B5DB
IHLPQTTASNLFIPNLPFLITPIPLPFLPIIPIPISKTNPIFQITSTLTKTYPYIFTIPLYLLIPPFFPLPSLPTTSF